MLKYFSLLLLLAFPSLAPGQITSSKPLSLQVGQINYFGYAGMDLDSVRARLPLSVGDSLTLTTFAREQASISQEVQGVTGRPPTDLAVLCCDDHHHLLVYVGLEGSSSRPVASLPSPHGTERLAPAASALYSLDLQATAAAVARGELREDDSAGYALSYDPAARKIQLSMRDYAVVHAEELERVLRGASNARQREASAVLLGYASLSQPQVDALAYAAHDEDPEVRNNAVRALALLALAPEASAFRIDPAPFVELLLSSRWTDRNKGSLLLARLTESRDPAVLAAVADTALPSLIEGATWTSTSHAYAFQEILGRVGGIPERKLQEMIRDGQTAAIVAAGTPAKASGS